MEKICGHRNRDEFLSRSNALHVSFTSDCGANDYGFTAQYQEVYGKDFGGDSIKSCLHYQSFLVQENLVKVFDANFNSVIGQRKL